jgi:GNAT superfamily N-acetyltransferase
MSFEWIRENPAQWDEPKGVIIGAAPSGIFQVGPHEQGNLIPGDWWRVEEAGAVVGYGWMDRTWGDAEILLAVDSRQRRRGVGSFILENLEKEAATQGVNYLYNTVRLTHPDRAEITTWLENREFSRSGDGWHKKQVGHG